MSVDIKKGKTEVVITCETCKKERTQDNLKLPEDMVMLSYGKILEDNPDRKEEFELHDEMKAYCKECYDQLPKWVKDYMPQIYDHPDIFEIQKEKIILIQYTMGEPEVNIETYDTLTEALSEAEQSAFADFPEQCWSETVLIIEGEAHIAEYVMKLKLDVR